MFVNKTLFTVDDGVIIKPRADQLREKQPPPGAQALQDITGH